MNGGVLVYFQSFLSAFLFLLALVVWLFVMKKPFYEGFRSRALFGLVLFFGFTFLILPFSFLHTLVGFARYVFQVLLLLVIVIACFFFYSRLKKLETPVAEIVEVPEQDARQKLLAVKRELDLRARDLEKSNKGLLKKESSLVKWDSKLKDKQSKLDSLENDIDDDIRKIKGLKRELARKQALLEDDMYKVEREKAKAVNVDKMREELEREMNSFDGREAALEQELVAYRSKLQDLEEGREDMAVEREKLAKLKAQLEEESALLREKKKRLLDAYEQLDKEKDVFVREQKSFERVKNLAVSNKGKKDLRGGRR